MAGPHDANDKSHRITLAGVARLAGASPITVSRAIRNPAMVAEPTRRRIMKVIAETGYIPDMAASMLASGHGRIVAIIIPRATNPANAEIFQGLADRLENEGLSLFLGTTRSDAEREQALAQAVIGWRPAALVLTGMDHTAVTRRLLAQADFPVIELADTADPPIDMAVGFDNAEAMAELTRTVWHLGYRSIDYIHIDLPQNSRFVRRREGFLAAYRELAAPAPRVFMAEDVTYEAGARAARELLAAGRRAEAVLCTNDVVATGAMYEFMRQGVNVPSDIAVAGFEGIELAAAITPSLTSVRVHTYEIGRISGENIVLRLAGKEVPRVVDTGFEVIVRASTPGR
jgi:LacI family gluconate utilization system Gnt-I transcriptional repressor